MRHSGIDAWCPRRAACLALLLVLTAVVPASARAAQPVPEGYYRMDTKAVAMGVSVNPSGSRVSVTWAKPERCHGRAYGGPVRSHAGGGGIDKIKVAPDGSFKARTRKRGGVVKYRDQDVQGRFETDGEWVRGRIRIRGYSYARAGDWGRCSTGGWVGFRAHLRSPKSLPGTWTGSTSQGLPVTALQIGRGSTMGTYGPIVLSHVVTRFAYTARLSCTQWTYDVNDQPTERQWTEDRVYDLPLGARIGSTKTGETFDEGGITGKLSGRTGTGTFSVDFESENRDTRCTASGTFTLRWQSRETRRTHAAVLAEFVDHAPAGGVS